MTILNEETKLKRERFVEQILDLQVRKIGPIIYVVKEDYGDELKIFCFARDGTYITDCTKEPTPKFLKELNKLTTYETQFPKKEIKKIEDITAQTQIKLNKIHHRLDHLLGLNIDYSYTIIADSSLKYSNNRLFGCKITGNIIKIPSNLLSGDFFSNFNDNSKSKRNSLIKAFN